MRKRTLTLTLEKSRITGQEMMAIEMSGHDEASREHEIILLCTTAIDSVVREMAANAKKKQDEVGKPSIILSTRLN